MQTDGLDAFIDDSEFSGVVVVRRGRDEVLFERAAGLASRRWNVPATLDTRFDSSGVTKLFTAAAVLQQVAAGNLDLELSIHHYVDLEGTSIPVEVNLLHLLTHTSGIADDADEDAGESYAALFAEFPAYTLVETADHLQLFAHKEPYAAPGSEAVYSNAGYVLAGLALERVTGRPYREYVAAEVFARVGMTDSGFWDRRDDEPRIAEGGDVVDGRWVSNVFGGAPIGGPADGAYATASDLLAFLDAVRAGRLLTPEFTEEFLLPQVEVDDETAFGFGLEFDLRADGSVRSFYKDGLGAGASAMLRHYVAEQTDVVVLSNSEEGAWELVTELDSRFAE